jgi:hypothetical protein
MQIRWGIVVAPRVESWAGDETKNANGKIVRGGVGSASFCPAALVFRPPTSFLDCWNLLTRIFAIHLPSSSASKHSSEETNKNRDPWTGFFSAEDIVNRTGTYTLCRTSVPSANT